MPNESHIEYYVIALGYDYEDRESSVNSNTVKYRIDREMQKQVSGDENKVKEYELSNNYPNPFNPSQKIKLSVPNVETLRATSLPVSLKIYDILGKEVATLVNEEKEPGVYEVEFQNVETLPATSLQGCRLAALRQAQGKVLLERGR